MRTPNHILAPISSTRSGAPSGETDGFSGFLEGGCSFGNSRAYPAPARSFQSAPRHAHRLTLLAPQKAPPASAPGSQGRCSPAALPAASTQTCLPAARRGKPCPQPARRSRLRYLGGRTHLRLRPAGAPAYPGRQARSPAVPGAERPWRLHAPGRPAASGPTRPGHRTPPQGSPGLRTSGLSRGG